MVHYCGQVKLHKTVDQNVFYALQFKLIISAIIIALHRDCVRSSTKPPKQWSRFIFAIL